MEPSHEPEASGDEEVARTMLGTMPSGKHAHCMRWPPTSQVDLPCNIRGRLEFSVAATWTESQSLRRSLTRRLTIRGADANAPRLTLL